MTTKDLFTKTDKYIDSITDLRMLERAIIIKAISRDDRAFFLALNATPEQLHLARQCSSRLPNKTFNDVGIPSSVLSRYVKKSKTKQ